MRSEPGLGKASAIALAREGVDLVIAARRHEVLESAADEIASATGNRPKAVVANVTTREGRDMILAASDVLSGILWVLRSRAPWRNPAGRGRIGMIRASSIVLDRPHELANALRPDRGMRHG